MKRFVVSIVTLCLLTVGAFTQSTEYSKYLAEAKNYEEKKQWAFALNSYYDAIGCEDEPSVKIEAIKGYLALSNTIKIGNPGLGKYNPFSMHDEWKKLLMDAEKLGSSICKYELRLGKLVQGDLNYETRTASYNSKIKFEISDRYKKTVDVIATGYDAARRIDWTDLPSSWPDHSASSAKNAVYDVAGAKIYEVPDDYKRHPSDYYNAFSRYHLYDYKFNIVDDKGRELVKGKKWLLLENKNFSIEGISSEIMNLIDSEKAFLNPVAVYLAYGKYNQADDRGERGILKNMSEVQLDISKAMVYCWNKTEDINAKRFDDTFYEDITLPCAETYVDIEFNGSKIAVCKTEVIQGLYEKTMGENPSNHKGRGLPVENVSWYDAICFCNKLSLDRDLEPVYSVKGEVDPSKWGAREDLKMILFPSERDILTVNESANGYRLPTIEEWEYAAKGGENYHYSGSDNRDEVGWFHSETHLVAHKKPNGYGLYDMSGNVEEWSFDHYVSGGTGYGFVRDGDYDSYIKRSTPSYTVLDDSFGRGFRIVRTLNNSQNKASSSKEKVDASKKKKNPNKKDSSKKEDSPKNESESKTKKLKKGLNTLWDLL